MDPSAISELIPDFREKGCPIEHTVEAEDVYFLTKRHALRFPITPPPLRNHGNLTISLAKFNRWLGGLVEAAGVNIFPGFAGVEILEENGAVTGVAPATKASTSTASAKRTSSPGIDPARRGHGLRRRPARDFSPNSSSRSTTLEGSLAAGLRDRRQGSVRASARANRGRAVSFTPWVTRFKSDNVGGTFIYTMANNLLGRSDW
jgi:hypothetical protein